jgi:hypothetical protein
MRGALRVALHGRLMRLHFLIHNRMPAAPGVDVQQLGLWF